MQQREQSQENLSRTRIRAIPDKIGVRHHSPVVGGIGGKTSIHQNHLFKGFPLCEIAISTQATECKQCTVRHAPSERDIFLAFRLKLNPLTPELILVCPSESCVEVIRTPCCPRSSHLHFRNHIHNLLQIHKVTWPNLRTATSTVGRLVCPIGCKLSTYSRQSEQGLVQMIATAVVLYCRELSHRCWHNSSSTPSSVASQHSFNLVVEHWSV